MANHQSLRGMLSHRVTFTYDTGAQVVGTVTACAPVEGPVEYVVLAKVEVKRGGRPGAGAFRRVAARAQQPGGAHRHRKGPTGP